MPATDDPNHSLSKQHRDIPPRRSSKSIAGAIAMGIIGGITLVGNFLLLTNRISDGIGGIQWFELPWKFKFWEMEFRFVPMALGVVMIVGALMAWSGRGNRGLICFALALVAMFAHPTLSHLARHYFLGNGVTIAPPVHLGRELHWAKKT